MKPHEDCQRCPLSEGRKNIVWGVGGVPNDVMVIGEAPGEMEDELGVPFVGRAGQQLNHLIGMAGFSLINCYTTNIVKCRPPRNRPPKREERAACLFWLMDEIETVDPEIVFLCGAPAISTLFTGFRLSEWHGRVREALGRKWCFTHHPAAGFYNSRKKQEVEKDFQAVGALLHSRVITRGLMESNTEAVDLETEGETIFCAGWTKGEEGFSRRWGEARLPPGKVVFHNAAFDIKYLRRHGVEVKEFDDTILKARLLNLPLGLKMLSPLLLGRQLDTLEIITKGQPFIKHEQAVMEYCKQDAISTKMLNQRLQLTPPLDRLYHSIDLPFVNVVVGMEMVGVEVDWEKLEEVGEKWEKLENHFSENMLLYGGIGNPHKAEAIRELLYEKWGFTPTRFTEKTGSPSVNAEALQDLLGQLPCPGDVHDPRQPFLSALLECRRYNKLISTYVEGWKNQRIGNRIFPSYNIVGTATGRLSSSKPNFQNIPEGGLRKAIVSPPGFVLVSGDANQLEMRVMAVQSGDKLLLKTYSEKKGDIHTATELRLHIIRKTAKAINFAIPYGGGAGIIAEKAEIPLIDAQRFHREYFLNFPGLKKWIDEQQVVAKESGICYNMFGRPRLLPGFTSGDSEMVAEAERQAINTPIQGTAADMIKMMMIDTAGDIEKAGGRFVGQVHDEVLVELPKDSPLLKNLAALWTEALTGGFPIPFPVKVVVGTCWG